MPTCGKHPGGSPEVTCHLCHAAARIDRAVETGGIDFASSVVADVCADEVKAVLDTLGLEWALVTDGSRVGDFDSLDLGGEMPDVRLSRVLGFGVAVSDYIVDVAKRLRVERG